jgi:hypothetical protein
MAFVRGHPLITFFLLAYALIWPVIPLVSVRRSWGFRVSLGRPSRRLS